MVAAFCSPESACPGFGLEMTDSGQGIQFKGAVARTFDSDLHEYMFYDCSLTRYFTSRSIRRIYTAAERAALAGADKFTGLRVFESDTFREYEWDGTGWVVMSEPVNAYNAAALTNFGAISAQSGYYHRSDGFCDYAQFVTLNAVLSGLAGIALPIAAASTDEGINFRGKIIDTGTNEYPVSIRLGTTSRADFYVQNAAGTYLVDTATTGAIPVALGAGDRVLLAGRYRMTTRYS